MRLMIINKITILVMAVLMTVIMTACSGDESGGGGGGGGAGSSTIDITSVTDGATVGLNTIIRTTVSNPANVSKVEFYVDGTLYHTSVSSPFQFNLYTGDAFTTGDIIEIQAIVYGTDGSTNDDTVASLVVDNLLPTVAISAPFVGDTVNGTAVTITTSAYDNSTASVDVDSVELYIDEQLLSTIPAGTGGGPFTYEITNWDTTTLGDGSHMIKAVAYDAGGNRAIDEVSVITDNGNPVVDISSPSNGAIVRGTSVLISVNASDTDGIAQVELFIDGSSAGTDTMLPYQFTWDTTAETNGSHTILVTATDNVGNNTSDTIAVTVDNAAPAVNITAPADTSTVTGSTAITVTASDNNSLASVKFYIDGILSSTDTVAPYAWTWDTADWADGGHSIKAVATDAGGLTTEDTISVTVDNDGPYNVKLTWPQASDTVEGSITLTATALDYAGTIDHVEFWLDGTTDLGDGTLNVDEYELTWNSTTTTDGQHGMTIIAYDDAGNVTSNNAATFWVDNTNPSTVTITSPAGGSDVSGTVNISVTANDGTGVGIDYVEILIDGSVVGVCDYVGGTSYEYLWDTVADPGSSITARAYDLLGVGYSTSAATTVAVDNVPPAGVNITSLSDGDYVLGTITITATATDVGSGIDRVEFYVDGVLHSTDTTGPSPYISANWVTTAATNGQHSIKVIAYDAAGNKTIDNDTAVTVDNAAPTISISNPTTGAYLKGTISLSASVTDNSTIDRVVFNIGGTLQTVSAFPYEYSWNTTSETEGVSISITATVYDMAGNTGTDTISVTVDNTAPDDVTAAISPITTPNFLSDNDIRDSVTVQATATDGQTGITKVRFSIDQVAGANDIEYTDVSSPYEYTWNTDPAFPNGEYTITMTSYDYAGNTSTATIGVTSVTVDNTNPGITSFEIDDDDGLTDTGDYITTATVNLSGVATDNVNVYQMRFSNSGVAGAWSAWEAYATSRSGWDMTSATYGGTNTDGTKTVYVQYRDNAGNSIQGNDTIFLDRVNPTADAGTALLYFNVATALNGTSADPGANPSGVASVLWSDLGTGSGGGTVTFGGTGAASDDPTFSANAEGTYDLQFYVIDNAGLTATDTATIHWDVTDPTANAGADQLLGPNMADRTINGVSSDGGTNPSGVYSVLWTDLGTGTGTGGGGTATFTASAAIDDPSFSATADGTYDLRFTVTDNATNSAFDDKTVTWDSTPPTDTTEPFVAYDAIGDDYTNDLDVTLDYTVTDTVSAAGDLEMRFRDDGNTYGAYGAYAAGTQTYTLSTTTRGTRTVYAQFRDEAQNVRTVSDTVFYDPDAPTATITTSPPGTTQSTTFTLSGTTSTDGTGSGIATYAWARTGGAGTGTVTFTDAGASSTSCSIDVNGDYEITLTVTDNAGNADTDVITITWNGTIDPSGNSIGEYSSIDMINDSGIDYVFVSYYDSTNGYLRFASANSTDWSTWQFLDVDTSADVGQHTSIDAELINDGTDDYFFVYITYYDATVGNSALKFATVRSAANSDDFTTTPTITTQVIDTTTSADVGQYSDLAVRVTGNGTAGYTVYGYVSYYDAINTSLRFAYADSSDWTSWTLQLADNDADVGQYSSITYIDNTTIYVYISYYDATTGDLKFARTTSDDFTDWVIPGTFSGGADSYTVDSTGNVGQYSSIKCILATTVAHIYISYYDATNGYLKFAHFSNTNQWMNPSYLDIVNVDTSADVGQHTSISVVDAATDFACISYYDADNTALKFAYSYSTDWTDWTFGVYSPQTVDSGGGVGGIVGLYSSVYAYDDNTIYISYYDQTGEQIKFVRTTDGGVSWSY